MRTLFPNEIIRSHSVIVSDESLTTSMSIWIASTLSSFQAEEIVISVPSLETIILDAINSGVGLGVGVFVGVGVGVLVGTGVGVLVGTGVDVGVFVGAGVGVFVGVTPGAS